MLHRKQSLIFFVICDKILPHVTKMKIDEKGENAWTRYKGGNVKTDHNILQLEVNLKFHDHKKHDRIEMFNLKNKTCQNIFKKYTSETNMFSKCFLSDEKVEVQFKKWQKMFINLFMLVSRK